MLGHPTPGHSGGARACSHGYELWGRTFIRSPPHRNRFERGPTPLLSVIPPARRPRGTPPQRAITRHSRAGDCVDSAASCEAGLPLSGGHPTGTGAKGYTDTEGYSAALELGGT